MKIEGKNICITGGLGFIGSHFVELLLEKCSGCSIDILDTVSYCVSEKTESFLHSIKSDNCLRINYIDITLEDNGVTTYYLKNTVVPFNSSLRAVSTGEKLILNYNNILRINF